MFHLLKVLIPDTDETVMTKCTDLKNLLSALVFKIMTDPFVGCFNFIRVYSGDLKSGSYVYNARTGN